MQTCLPGDTQHRAAVPRAGRPWAHHPPPRPGPTRSSRLPLPRATRLSRPLRVFCLRERRCHPSPRTARHPGQHSTLRPRLPAPEHQLHQAGRPGGPAKAVLRAGDAESRAGPCPLPAVPPTPAAKPASSCLPGSPEARASGGTGTPQSHTPHAPGQARAGNGLWGQHIQPLTSRRATGHSGAEDRAARGATPPLSAGDAPAHWTVPAQRSPAPFPGAGGCGAHRPSISC